MSAPAVQITGAAEVAGVRLFAPLALTLGAGRWCCLLGPSGVGKSTLLRLVAGLSAAQVRFDGAIVADDGLPLQGRVAMMAQSDLLLPWLSVLDNVTLGARLRGEASDRARARDLLDQVGLRAHLGTAPAALSGGQRQRVALARTLMEDRPVVLLDEPFAALDVRSRTQMQDLTARLLAGRTVLHVTHDTAEAARLGQDVQVMTREGITAKAPPAAPVPRRYDAGEVLGFQARLHRLMMASA
ncbi:ABC transporter ATP-binding protein [Sagittula sp. SSi028]|uniref:ABC transporter ATP-binding protein n=1 Tax=Sagittula sp. SSi028 TaxID=3400636 RepID=UPI003AF91D45